MKRRTHAELLERVRAELRTNPTIEVYEFAYGEEWLRRPANPWLAASNAFARFNVAAEGAREAIAAMAAQTATPTHMWRP